MISSNFYSLTLSPGAWIIIGSTVFPSCTDHASLGISTSSNNFDSFYQVYHKLTATQTTILNITRTVNISSSTTYYLVGESGPSITVSSVIMYASRIG